MTRLAQELRSAEIDGTQSIADALSPPSIDELIERAYGRAQAELRRHMSEQRRGDKVEP